MIERTRLIDATVSTTSTPHNYSRRGGAKNEQTAPDCSESICTRTMQRSTPAAKSSPRIERTQQALLEALLELIVEQGYDRTTVEDILRRADVGRTAFYAHFENKRDLLLNRFSTIPWLQRRVDGGFDATFLFGHLADERALVYALRGTAAFDEAIVSMRESLLGAFTRLLEDHAADKDESHRQMTALALTGALMQLLLWWVEAEMPETPATMARWFAQLSERMVDA
jgi:AcrR family transcriptional regulator